MTTAFSQLNNEHEIFFNMLPEDWQAVIVPIWDQYKHSSKIYVLKKEDEVIAGGIIFSECPPDMTTHLQEAKKWLDNNYLYIGFLFVVEPFRNQKLGSRWIEELKTTMPKQNFWLVIEEEDLGKFYEKHQFKLEKVLASNQSVEWLYAYHNTKS